MERSTLNTISSPAPPGFKWILVCTDCKYCFCFECLASCIKNSPCQIDILNNWLMKNSGMESYSNYFRERRDLLHCIMTGGPNQGQVYLCLYTPYMTYQDYCMILQQVKHDGCIWITFECDNFKDHYYSWSGWLYLLFWHYCPRDLDFFNETDRTAFKIWFHAEVCEAALHEAWFTFSLSYVGSFLEPDASSSTASSFKIVSDYYGHRCIPKDELIEAMRGSPFYESFGSLPPFSDDHSSPPSSHGYDSDGMSFDSIAEFNINNSMEA